MGNTSIQTQSYRAVDKDAGQSRSYIIPFALLCSLFFLWAVANNLNDILLPQFQQAFTLTNFQAGLIQSAFYFGYFIIPIPAGLAKASRNLTRLTLSITGKTLPKSMLSLQKPGWIALKTKIISMSI